MKRRFLILLSTIFALAAIGLVIIQISQTKRSAKMSDNLFNISVNNAIDEVFNQLDQMKVEDYISEKERYRIIRYRRIDDMNEKMQDIIRDNSELFYDEHRVSFGVSSQDSAFALPNARLTQAEEYTLTQYNTMLNARNRMMSGLGTTQSNKSNPLDINNVIDASKFNFPLLDSLIREELIINGVDINPYIGVLKTDVDTLIYCSKDANPNDLRNSAFKYTFHAHGITPDESLYVVLSFPPSPIILSSDTNLYTIISICMIVLISALFVFSIRTILAQHKLDEMKTDFINNMTHEIKTPLATIGLACEMLKDETVTSDLATRRNFVNIISDENRRMRVLIETLLQSAKMSGKKFSISPKEIDLNSIVQESVQSFLITIENRHGSLSTDLNPINGILFADELHISNMMHNLIDNAIKYSVEPPQIHISTHTEEGAAVIRITDHGIGISKDDQKHVFEKFYRVSTGNVHNVKGFGIGLNYVSQVVALHKGKISLTSELGQGSTFTISLPLE
ncbi:MAG: HAMP domain-containing histidine kinase [Bacteroidales bacterium]|nr:HAMP domain-containing histidine kinase [Bacteroidales bacterium]